RRGMRSPKIRKGTSSLCGRRILGHSLLWNQRSDRCPHSEGTPMPTRAYETADPVEGEQAVGEFSSRKSIQGRRRQPRYVQRKACSPTPPKRSSWKISKRD